MERQIVSRIHSKSFILFSPGDRKNKEKDIPTNGQTNTQTMQKHIPLPLAGKIKQNNSLVSLSEPFPKRQILDSSKPKQTADDNFKLDENG